MGKIRNVVISSLAAVGIVAGVLVGGQVLSKAQADAMVDDNIEYMDIDDSYYFENPKTLERYEIRKIDTTRPVLIYLDKNYNEEEQFFANVVLNNLNEVFAKMNSGLYFQVVAVEELPDITVFDANTILCSKALIPIGVGGINYVNSDYIELSINEEMWHEYANSTVAFIHEILHSFGLGDAYNVEGNTTPSIMHGIGDEYSTRFLSVNDMKMLASMYGKFETEQEWLDFMSYAEEKANSVLKECEPVSNLLEKADMKPTWMSEHLQNLLFGKYVNEDYCK